MPAGRTKTPTAIKVLQGTDRKDRILQDEMAVPVLETIPMPPQHVLSEDGENEWYRVCATLLDLGMLHAVDRGAILGYCVEYQTYLEAAELVKHEGLTIQEERGMSGTITKVNPNLTVRNAAFKNMMSAANQFGFTPAARTRIRAEAKPKENDPFDEMLNMDKK